MLEDVKIYRSDSFQTMDWGGIFRDMFAGIKLWRIWLALSWQEFRSTYKRSIFGIMWVIVSFAGFVFIKLIIFSSLIETEDGKAYSVYLTLGIYLWMYLVSSVNSAPGTFTAVSGWIKSEPLPLSLYIFKNIMRELYNFGLTFIVVIGAFLYLDFKPDITAVYALPAIIFFIANATWIKALFGIVGARFRDVGYFINAVTLPLMFLTPIFWTPEQMPNVMKYMWWNPFFHYLEIFRAPFLTGEFPLESWVFVLTLMSLGWAVAFVCFARLSHRVVFWL